MKVETLNGFDFDDCYFLDFAVDPLFSRIMLKTEAYFPSYAKQGERKFGILIVKLDGVTELEAKVRPPFAYDLEANEIYELTLSMNNEVYAFSLNSDYLTLSVKCIQARLEESE
jgi:hypothetical protein